MLPPRAWVQGLLLPPSQYRSFLSVLLKEEELPDTLLHLLRTRAGSAGRLRWADEVLRATRRHGGRVLVPAQSEYPRTLLNLHQPPPALFVRGNPQLLREEEKVAVVGTRRASPDAKAAASRLGRALAMAKLPVVSGLARGVDRFAHEGCLAGNGRPVAVLGTGFDEAYPPAHAELQEEVARRGCLVSEYPPGTGARPWHFVARNRLIAALASLVVVVEAGKRSGALITAEFANELGREVMAFPGSAEDPAYEGCLALLKDGAGLARGASDVLQELGRHEAAEQLEIPLGLHRPLSPAEIARMQGMELSRVLAELAQLEFEGQVRRVAGGRYLATGRSGGSS
ncbi:MAG TPA: DNA-processing protein DprA [Candidatus Krumholzibacteria bacterium]|nr:DNA-processing protein DprA [Candidatus Krumholzibacteria bacterium]